MSLLPVLTSKRVPPLPMVLQKIKEENQKTDGLSIYVGSTPVDRWLPGFRAANDVEIPVKDALVSFWLATNTYPPIMISR